ncbi:hypothetical protein BDN72DRAFT_877354 [Pluteus cervinus]|uniref:Uncharacterized protein n=1 Tax=Pluteus cervinus TaxID=181527 RepID=A0ACD3AZ48_9AGAR|nr:hypothetical protein BDN72DRAFT_877354 [Pluteus cervinus]
MVVRQPYSGASRKLVVAFDVGTTFSGVSYCLLDPGKVPEITGITRYPSQEFTKSDSKIPSIIWYGQDGQVRAVGAEAASEENKELAEIEQWVKVEWFKLHLRPKGLADESTTELLKRTPPLPLGLTVVDVFADFLRYLLDCTRVFIQESGPSGTLLWSSIESSIEFVISHPNGWGGVQQGQLRQAAIQAQLIPNTDAGAQRVRFVTEGEASLHSCITRDLTTEAMKNDGKIIIVDAGGGTIDISSYTRRAEGGKQLYEELGSPRCILRGSIFVTEYARRYLTDYLEDSPFADIVPDICDCFDKTTKLRFRSAEDPGFIKFGTPRDHDVDHNISYGRLKLPGEKIAEFFKPAVNSIVQVVMDHFWYLGANTVFLVGGFAESDWLFHQVKSAVAAHGVDVCRPDKHANKIVADGGVSFFIDHYVSARIAKYAYGVMPSGRIWIPGAFSVILPKNTKVTEQELFRQRYCFQETSTRSLEVVTQKILFYTGALRDPEWLDEDRANLKSYVSKLSRQRGSNGKEYYQLDFEVVILFGLTELIAQVAWKEKDIEKRYGNFPGTGFVTVRPCFLVVIPGSPMRTVETRNIITCYSGTSRKLVVAFDIGTTFSGVSYCLLDPGQVPEIKGITRYPSQELTRSDSKIPSIIWYGQGAQVRAVGAQAEGEGVEEVAHRERWIKVEWFKLHLRPNGLADGDTAEILQRVLPLPLGLNIVTVFADFLRYLLDCTRNFIQESSPSGILLWSSIESDIEFVISHPNGWGGLQQSQLRQAAIQAQLVPATDAGAKRVHFITEGEASLHSCISKKLTTEAMKNDGRVVVVDAGGGTIDISSYSRRTSGGKQLYEELASPRCELRVPVTLSESLTQSLPSGLLRGSIFVTEHARRYLSGNYMPSRIHMILLPDNPFKDFLKDSTFASAIDDICGSFDKTTKLRFRSAEDPGFIKFGTPRDHDVEHDITYGRLKLPGEKVAEFFEPAVSCIIQVIVEHLHYLRANTVFLVGGFAASDWLFYQVREAVAPLGVDLCRPDSHVNKVVADGAVSFLIDHYVSARMAKYTYGVEVSEDYDESNSAHILRQLTRFTMPSGSEVVPGSFSVVLCKNTKVTEQEVFRSSYVRERTSICSPVVFKEEVLFYAGSMRKPRWLDEDEDNFQVLCTIEADLTSYATSVPRRRSPTGKEYYCLNYDVIISFGLTEIVAQVAWKEKGIEKRSPARIIYDDENDDEE